VLRVLGCVPDRGWLVMELCAGGSLKARAMRRVFSSYAVPTCVKKPISVWLHHQAAPCGATLAAAGRLCVGVRATGEAVPWKPSCNTRQMWGHSSSPRRRQELLLDEELLLEAAELLRLAAEMATGLAYLHMPDVAIVHGAGCPSCAPGGAVRARPLPIVWSALHAPVACPRACVGSPVLACAKIPPPPPGVRRPRFVARGCIDKLVHVPARSGQRGALPTSVPL